MRTVPLLRIRFRLKFSIPDFALSLCATFHNGYTTYEQVYMIASDVHAKHSQVVKSIAFATKQAWRMAFRA